MGFDWEADYIKIDQEYLLNEFGRKKDPKRNEASIEDLCDCIHFFLNEQESGNLPIDIFIAIDSIGVLNCNQTISAQEKGTSDNAMWNARAMEIGFKPIINSRIPATRKQTHENTTTLVAVQKIWIDNMGAGVVKHKGGEAMSYGARLIYHFGGIQANGARIVSATSKKKDVRFGIETKVNSVKNHIDGPLGGISMEGKIISTPHGFIAAEKDSIDAYKKEHILHFRNILGDEINAEDLGTSYHQMTTNGDDLEQTVDDFHDTLKVNFGGNDIDVDPETGEVKE
jgi:hypothetical protein